MLKYNQTEGRAVLPYWNNSNNTQPAEANKLTRTEQKQITYANNQIYTKLRNTGARIKKKKKKTLAITQVDEIVFASIDFQLIYE